MKGRRPSPHTIAAARLNNIGRKLSSEHIEKVRLKNIGSKRSEEGKKNMSIAAVLKYQNPENRRNLSLRQMGEKSNNWKGGITPINRRLRQSVEFRLWREAVFARDNWTCQKCEKRGGKLHPHHIKAFADYPELRFAIDNGETLCVPCHYRVHTKKCKEASNG
jgi:HNH endonuclease